MKALTHLDRLEAESIHIMREVVAEAENPVFLYSVGKDSSVMLHLAAKAFYPAPPPFPFLHIASGWDFRDLLDHRDRGGAQSGDPFPVPRRGMVGTFCGVHGVDDVGCPPEGPDAVGVGALAFHQVGDLAQRDDGIHCGHPFLVRPRPAVGDAVRA